MGVFISKEQANKEIVIEAYQRTFGDLDVAAIDEFFSKDFKQHNPTIADGAEGVKALVRMLSSQGVSKQKSNSSISLPKATSSSSIRAMKWQEPSGGLSTFIVLRTASWLSIGMR